MNGLIVYSGALAQVPHQAGLTWFHLQFLLGLRRLGWKILFLDWLTPEMCFDSSGLLSACDESVNLKYFLDVMRMFGLEESFSLNFDNGRQVYGLSMDVVLEQVQGAELLLNVMGYLKDSAILERIGKRVFIDIDPGFGQMWRELGWCDPFANHEVFVTMGRNIGRPECTIPTSGLKWLTMPQPVVLDLWPVQPSKIDGAFTSIGAWRGPNGPIEFMGKSYGLRAHEFRKHLELPLCCPNQRFEMALEIHPGDNKDLQLLGSNGWHLANPKIVAAGPREYRDYLSASKAELMIPKQMYVESNSGLLSDRSVYYLATGRPVLARDTGIRDLYPTGEGLLTFQNVQEAVHGVFEIDKSYLRHCESARSIAETYFDSDKVLTDLLSSISS